MSKEIRIQKKICGFISRLCGLEYSLKPPKDMLQWKVTTHLNQNSLRLSIRQKLYITFTFDKLIRHLNFIVFVLIPGNHYISMRVDKRNRVINFSAPAL